MLNRISQNQTIVGAGLLCIISISIYLRLRNLGNLGFRWDEDITALAVRAILENGYPVLPTGVVYLRALPFHYLLTVSTALFGFNEFSLRIVSASFGTGTVVLAYLVAARFFDRAIALIVAGLISVSFQELEMARNARMYAPFGFFYLLTVFAFYHFYIDGNGRCRFIATLLAVVTITIHTLGFTLALLSLIPFLCDGFRVANRGKLMLHFCIVSIWFCGWFYLERAFLPT
jgi:4-amino-4-deoxy-L-arabinose transferase-like glycosyltransferase